MIFGAALLRRSVAELLVIHDAGYFAVRVHRYVAQYVDEWSTWWLLCMDTLEFEISKSHQHGRLWVDGFSQELGHGDLIIPIRMPHEFYRLHTTAAQGVKKSILATVQVARELCNGV